MPPPPLRGMFYKIRRYYFPRLRRAEKKALSLFLSTLMKFLLQIHTVAASEVCIACVAAITQCSAIARVNDEKVKSAIRADGKIYHQFEIKIHMWSIRFSGRASGAVKSK